MITRLLSCCLSVPLLLAAAPDQEAAAPAIRTSRPDARKLPLPKGDDVFHFIIFGDRTGGPVTGLEVLRQAVTDTNLLDPDLVMTVGDLLPGYIGADGWEDDAVAFRSIMDGLRMPWFPVPGNHDVYWRGPGRPEREHEADFEKHFGPLWYWFAHKNCGFLVLYTDEGDPSRGPKDFTNPDQQKMSPEQLEWLRKSVAEMKDLDHVFVFLHHPRWIERSYPGSNWNETHSILASAGNVRAVFAGHIHRMRYEGVRDGIEYITLGTTGGSSPGHYPQAGYLHHMNLVTVRRDGWQVAVLPVGEVMDPRQFTPELISEIERVRNLDFQVDASPIAINEDGLGTGLFAYSVANPSRWPVEITVLPDEAPREWLTSADHLHLKLEPGGMHSGSFSLVRVRREFEPFTIPAVEVRAELLAEHARIPLPPRRITLPVALKGVPADFFSAPANGALNLDGASAVRIEMGSSTLPDGPFTVETWVMLPPDSPGGDLVSKAEQSEFALNVASGVPGFHVFIGDKYESAIATAALQPGTWHHVAGVYDGSSLRLFVNGQPAAERAASGSRKTNPLPLFIGANPDARSRPTQFLTGKIDEVRLSRAARYTGPFTPDRRLPSDEATLYLFRCDRTAGPFLPSDSPGNPYGTITGNVTITPAEPAASTP